MDPLSQVRLILTHTLKLGLRGEKLSASSSLLGALPELDSLALASILTSFEEQLGIKIEDDEINAETFATLGSLSDFVARKLAGQHG
jgi:acyl carrier protein